MTKTTIMNGKHSFRVDTFLQVKSIILMVGLGSMLVDMVLEKNLRMAKQLYYDSTDNRKWSETLHMT